MNEYAKAINKVKTNPLNVSSKFETP